ncbi:hypothetical protein B0H12DRAFT_1069725 [Mycena haematopus]|nr:hypothetical protein B0H12DRAFT_1069725 [Mycena haematopus]
MRFCYITTFFASPANSELDVSQTLWVVSTRQLVILDPSADFAKKNERRAQQPSRTARITPHGDVASSGINRSQILIKTSQRCALDNEQCELSNEQLAWQGRTNYLGTTYEGKEDTTELTFLAPININVRAVAVVVFTPQFGNIWKTVHEDLRSKPLWSGGRRRHLGHQQFKMVSTAAMHLRGADPQDIAISVAPSNVSSSLLLGRLNIECLDGAPAFSRSNPIPIAPSKSMRTSVLFPNFFISG